MQVYAYIRVARCVYMCRLTHTYTQACATVCIDQCVCTQKDFDVFKKAREVFGKAREVFLKTSAPFHVGADWITLPDPIISSFPFILTFQSKRTVYQTVNNDSTSPHPRFSRAFQVPSQSAFRAHNAILVFYEWKEAERAMTRCSFMTGSLSTGRFNG